MSSFVCVFCSRCQPNSVNTFPILITDQMQPHCILCPLHGLRDGGRTALILIAASPEGNGGE